MDPPAISREEGSITLPTVILVYQPAVLSRENGFQHTYGVPVLGGQDEALDRSTTNIIRRQCGIGPLAGVIPGVQGASVVIILPSGSSGEEGEECVREHCDSFLSIS